MNSTLEKLGDEEVKAQGLRVGRGHLGHKRLAIPSLLVTEIPHVVMFMVIKQTFIELPSLPRTWGPGLPPQADDRLL